MRGARPPPEEPSRGGERGGARRAFEPLDGQGGQGARARRVGLRDGVRECQRDFARQARRLLGRRGEGVRALERGGRVAQGGEDAG